MIITITAFTDLAFASLKEHYDETKQYSQARVRKKKINKVIDINQKLDVENQCLIIVSGVSQGKWLFEKQVHKHMKQNGCERSEYKITYRKEVKK